tara:strand:+ start:3535 stop:3729 length:195 start_codon:yes stop_codon:yes gene_type:complete
LYIFHLPIGTFLAVLVKSNNFDYFYGHLVLFIGMLILSYVFAWLSYRYFEKPILKLKDKYAPLK